MRTIVRLRVHNYLPRSSRNYSAAAATPRPYTFHIGASFVGKPPWPEDLLGKTPPFPDTHPVVEFRDRMLGWKRGLQSKDAGQDFLYVQEMRNSSGISLGVADGVGGWGPTCDPALFSQALMYYASVEASKGWPGEPETDPTQDDVDSDIGIELTPTKCLEKANAALLADPDVIGGGSTACIINLNATYGILRSANLGDSGFHIIRNSDFIYSEPPQTHFFNCPYQLSKTPYWDKTKQAFRDNPRRAAPHSTRVRHGDIVIAYTDGFSDNVFPNEILEAVSAVMRQKEPENVLAQQLADHLVALAWKYMFSDRVSPFEVEAAQHGQRFMGGKVDDVSLIVAIVQETS